jgi:P4 family phage/plasmid primase-like protien
MDATDVVKKAVGEDSILYEKKGQDPIHFFSHAKLLFSANGMPENVEDKSDAFYRRLLILEMDHVIEADRKDTSLKDRIGLETDYAVHKAMDALHYLYQRGFFEESENSQKCVREAKRDLDTVQTFLEETIERKEGSRIVKSTMYDLYESCCKENGRQPLGKSRFMTEMERKGFVVRKYDGIYKFKNVSKKDH